MTSENLTRRRFLKGAAVAAGVVVTEAAVGELKKPFSFLDFFHRIFTGQKTEAQAEQPAEVVFGPEVTAGIESLKNKIAEVQQLEKEVMATYGHDQQVISTSYLIEHCQEIINTFNPDTGSLRSVDLRIPGYEQPVVFSPEQNSQFILGTGIQPDNETRIAYPTAHEHDPTGVLYNPFALASFISFYDEAWIKEAKSRLPAIKFGEGNFVLLGSGEVTVSATDEPNILAEGEFRRILGIFGATLHESHHALDSANVFATAEGYLGFSAEQCLEVYGRWLRFMKENPDFVNQYFFEVNGDRLHEFLAQGNISRVVTEMMAISSVNVLMGNGEGWNWPGADQELRQAAGGQGANLEAIVLNNEKIIREYRLTDEALSSPEVLEIRQGIGRSLLLYAREKLLLDENISWSWQLIIKMLSQDLTEYYSSTEAKLAQNWNQLLITPVEEWPESLLSSFGSVAEAQVLADKIKAELTNMAGGKNDRLVYWLYFIEFILREKGALYWPDGKLDTQSIDRLQNPMFDMNRAELPIPEGFPDGVRNIYDQYYPGTQNIKWRSDTVAYEGKVAFFTTVVVDPETQIESLVMHRLESAGGTAVFPLSGTAFTAPLGTEFSDFAWNNASWGRGRCQFRVNNGEVHEFYWGMLQLPGTNIEAARQSQRDEERRQEFAEAARTQINEYIDSNLRNSSTMSIEFLQSQFTDKSECFVARVGVIEQEGIQYKVLMFHKIEPRLSESQPHVDSGLVKVISATNQDSFQSFSFDPTGIDTGRFSYAYHINGESGNQNRIFEWGNPVDAAMLDINSFNLSLSHVYNHIT